MIQEAYCSFEVAKLLKEKGFNCPCKVVYSPKGIIKHYLKEEVYAHNLKGHKKLCPTHQMTMKWLREIYHLEINITFGFPFIDGKQQYKYFWSIVRVCDNHLEYPMDDPNSAYYNEEMADSYEEAVEAALKYVLKNLI
jgi:hypothetical protein